MIAAMVPLPPDILADALALLVLPLLLAAFREIAGQLANLRLMH